MLVASGVEFGDAYMAAVGQVPQMIGNIETAIGCGTIRRASGIAVQVMIGDLVCQGDVIETAADGRIEIRFIDGTVFKLSRDTRVVLSEFARDSNGTLRSALFAVARGTFAFIAGRLAKTGSLTVDTPVGSIRSRARAGGIGMLSFSALIFSFMKEVQAADPNVAFLDDDTITYKDLEHGVFELITKEAIPRHIIVEDPGETIVLSRRGSSVSVNEVANSLTRMQELQTAQQDALANFAKGLGPNGSSTPPLPDLQQLLRPINFIQTDAAHPQNSLLPLESAVFTVPAVFIVPPTLAITSIGGQIAIAPDNIINASKANAGVEITGTASGVEDGRVVTVTIVDSSNRVVYSGTATVTTSTWLVNLSSANAKALADGIYTVTADVSNAVGIPAEASQAIRVDETPPTIAIDTIVSNNVVNANAASAGFAIAGITSDAENGQPVTVKIVDSSGQVVDAFTTAVTNNAWSVNVNSTEAKLLHDGSYTVTADVSDAAGNPAPQATQAFTVDETLPTVTWLPQAESGVEGTTNALGAITATVNSLPGHSNSVQSLVVSGIPVGAVLTDGTNNFMATSGNTSIDVKSWNLSNLKVTPPNDTNFILTITATDQDANTASASELVTVAPLAPNLNPVIAQGNEDTAIALDLGVTVKSLSGANGDASPNSLDTLVVSGIPVGATLSDGTGLPGHSFTASAGNTSHDVASWNLSSLTITPLAEFEGSFTLTIAATEHDSEGDISATTTTIEVVTVAPVAGPPTASAPATLTLNENATGAALAGVSVGPLAEDNDDAVSATLAVSHGTLHVGSLSGVTVTGDDSATLTLSGSAAAVNILLAGLTYTPAAEYEGSDTLHLSVTSSDGPNTYPTTATASTAITVNPVAEPPAASAPTTLTLNENAIGAALAGVSVGPLAEDNDDTVSATLAVSHGTLHVGSLSGVTVTGDDSTTLTLSGSTAAVNMLLAGLTYTPAAEYEGSDTLHLSVTSSDGTNTYPTTATASTAITVNPVAEQPTAAAPTTLTLNENATGVALAGVSVGPLAEDNDDTVSATLAVSHGTLHVGSLSGVTVTGVDSATLTLSGSTAAVNMLLAGLTYTPAAEYEGSDTLHLSVTSSDGPNTYPTTATASTAITVNPVAEPPAASAPTTATTAANTAIDISGVVVGPAAEDTDDTVIVLLTVAHGTLAVSPVAGVTETVNGPGSLTVSGTASDVNTALASLVYTPTTSFIGSDTLNVSVTSLDGSDTYPTQATAATAIAVTLTSESLIAGGPGPTLDWNDPANWSGGVVPTFGINTTINAPSNYTVIITITGTPDAQAASLTIPHGAATTDIKVNGTLQLAGDLDVSASGKFENDGTLEETTNATFIGPITNNGTIIVDPNVYLDVTGTITGIGNFWIDSGATLEFALGSKVAPGTTDRQIIYFEPGAGKLIIDDWAKFAGVITGTDIGTHLTSTDLIDLTQLPYVGGSMSVSVSYNSGTNISTMTFSDGISANNVTLHLSGNYTGTAWSFTSVNGGAGTEIYDPPTGPGTVTVDSGATGEIAAASAATIDIANASGTNSGLVLDNSQNFTGQIVGFTGDGTVGTLSAGQTFTSPPTRSAGSSGTFTKTAAGVQACTPDNNNDVVNALNTGDKLTDISYGGSGNDTINGNNDIVIGVFGADLLAGGNGDDAFAYLSRADSNAAQFDTITDFVSGSDKIDLTALGKLSFAILALTSTNTSVPAHTIAWLREGKANETIVYVNPTDQTLRIGDPGLLEIHRQGTTTIKSSDFILAPTTMETVVAAGDPIDLAATPQNDATIVTTTTADVSSDATVSNNALFADLNWTAQTTSIGDSFDAAPNQIDSVDDAKFANFDESGTASSEYMVDDAMMTPPSGLSIELPQVAVTALTQTSFALYQKPVFDSADLMTIGRGSAMHGPAPEDVAWIVPSESDLKVNPETNLKNEDHEASIPKNAGSMNAGETYAPEIDAGPNVVRDSGVLKTPESGGLNRSIASEGGERGAAPTHGASVHGFEPSSISQVVSGGTVGVPGDSFHFKDEISALKGSGITDVAEPNHIPASMSPHEDAAGTHGPLVISKGGETPDTVGDSFHFKDEISGFKGSGLIDVASIVHHEDGAATHVSPAISAGAQAIELLSPGQHPDDHFNIVPDRTPVALVTHVPHDLIV
jgi:hypothetical protein